MAKLPVIVVYWDKWVWVLFKVFGWLIMFAVKIKIISPLKAMDCIVFVGKLALKQARYKLKYS